MKAKGFVQCAVNTGLAGFSLADSQGKWTGLDVDLCKAIAAAMFGDAEKAKFTPTTAQQRFVALQSGEVDVITRNATQTLLRDTSLGFNIAGVNFYDGQGFMVPAKSGIKSAKELNGATICVQPGTTTELNLADYFRKNKMTFKPVLIEKLDELLQAYAAGRCDSYTTDASGLAAVRAGQLAGKGEHTILPERISKEPLGPIVRHGDDQWFDLVKWTLMGMIEAEELGITSKNVDEMLKSDDPAIKRFLGVTPGYGKAVGVDEKWMYNVIKQIGNYGESYERNVGANTPLKLERGQNALWTNGGLMYAIPRNRHFRACASPSRVAASLTPFEPRICLMRPVETTSAAILPARSRSRWASWVATIQPVGRSDLDRVGIDAAHRPGRATGDQRPADGDRVVGAAAPHMPGGARIGRDVGAGDRRRHRLALAELLEGEHAAGAEIDPERALRPGFSANSNEPRSAPNQPSARRPSANGMPFCVTDGLAVAPRQVEQRRLRGVEPGAGDRLDLGFGDRRQRGLQSLVAGQRLGRDGVRQPPRIDAAEIGDHHDGEIGRRHAQELGAEARPQAAMADGRQAAQLADATPRR